MNREESLAMKHLQWIAISLVAMSASAVAVNNATDAAFDARAKDIHQRVLTVDSHVDVLLPSTPKRYYAKDGKSAAEIGKLRQGGVDVIALAIAVGPGPRTKEGDRAARAEADEKLATIRAFLENNAGDVALVRTSDDILRVHNEGKIAVIESFLNARSLAGDGDAIDKLYDDGVRIFGFTHAGNNAFADSSRPQGEPAEEHHGLSPLGKQAVARLNKLGVIIDVSQLTPAGVSQVLQLTKAPVIASHSAARTLVDNSRNLSDRELDAIKANGGVVHVPPFTAYLAPHPKDYDVKVRAVRKEFGLKPEFSVATGGYSVGVDALSEERQTAFSNRLRAITGPATLQNYVDHIDYIAKRIGVDHVGIGTDFNHGSGVTGFGSESEAPNVTRELLRRGYTEEQVAQIWSGNFLRVFRAVEAVAGKLQSS
jgi:membrane dipeptidase